MSDNAVDDAPLSGFHKRLALYSSGGPFLDGYILSIIGIAMVQISPQLHVSTVWEGLLGASALIGIFIGGGIGGYLTDIFGRQTLYTIDLIAIIVCSLLQFFVSDVAILFLLRLGIGIAVGADYPIATSLLAEFTPRRFRGPLLGGLVVMWFVGATAAYFIGDALMVVGNDAWRWMLLSPAIPATIIVLLRLGTPESPRWLLTKGRREEANAVMRKVYGAGASVDDLPPVQESVKFGALLRGGYLGRIAYVTTFWTCSIVPLFAMQAFGPKILAALNVSSETADLSSALISLLFLIGCVLALVVINRTGRRRLVIWSFLISSVGLLVVGFMPNAPMVLLAAAFLVYALGIGGTQILQWIYPNELFPTEVRGTAVGIASSLSRIGAAVGTYLVPLALTGLGVGVTMLIGAAVTLLGVIVSVLWAPETTNLALHEASALGTTVRTTSRTTTPNAGTVRG